MPNRFASIAFSLLLLAITFELLRRRTLREKYAAIWVVLSAMMLTLTFFPKLLGYISVTLGFQVSSNFFILLVLFFLVLVVMQLSLEVGKLEHEAQRLGEEIAIMQNSSRENDN